MLHRLNNVNDLNVLDSSYYSAYGIYICKTHVLNALCTVTFLNVKVMPTRRAGTYASTKYGKAVIYVINSSAPIHIPNMSNEHTKIHMDKE